jgi:hypothetical protein
MKIKEYPIDGDTADSITKIVLGETIKNLTADIKKLNKYIKQGEKSSYIYLDLNDNIKYLQAAQHMYEYFGGNLK